MDSGTTFVYFSFEMFTEFKNEWAAFCRSSNKHCAKISDFQTCYTYNNATYPRLEDFFATFPPVSFKLDVNTTIIWEPSDYLYVNDDSKDYCLGIQPLKDLIFGEIFMKNLDVMFDLHNKRVGFAQANCDGIPKPPPSLPTAPTPESVSSPTPEASLPPAQGNLISSVKNEP